MRFRMRKWLVISTLAAALGCSGGDKPAKAPPAEPAAATTEAAPAKIEWIHDDYPAALAAAKKAGVPLVIDMWAEWCHTCISMQAYVLADRSLVPMANRFVWLAMDTDKETNAAALEKYPVNVWPTFFVVSPNDESVQARYLGAATVPQFREFLLQGEHGHQDAMTAGGKLDKEDPVALLRAGDRAAIEGRWLAAETAYLAALEKGPDFWPRQPDVLVSLMSAMYRGEGYDRCVKLALGPSAKLTGNAASAADFQYYAMTCADKLGDAELERQIYAAAETRLRALVADESAPCPSTTAAMPCASFARRSSASTAPRKPRPWPSSSAPSSTKPPPTRKTRTSPRATTGRAPRSTST